MTILEEAARLTTEARQGDYGHPLDDWTRVAGMFNAAFAYKLKEPFSPEELMLVMILVKVSREVNKPKRDNRTDICGYANCIELTHEERARRTPLANLPPV